LESIDRSKFCAWVDEQKLSPSKFVHINEYTKIKHLLNFTKSSHFIQYILNEYKIDDMINIDKISELVDKINLNLSTPYLEAKMDTTKVIATLIELNDDHYISIKDLLMFLEIQKDTTERTTIIFNNIS
jgi:hypothetical protein